MAFEQKMNAMKRFNAATHIFETYFLNSEFALKFQTGTVSEICTLIKNNQISASMFLEAQVEVQAMIQKRVDKFCKTKEFLSMATLLVIPKVSETKLTNEIVEEPKKLNIVLKDRPVSFLDSLIGAVSMNSKSLACKEEDDEAKLKMKKVEPIETKNPSKPMMENLDFDRITEDEQTKCPGVIHDIVYEMKRRGCQKTEGIFRMSGAHLEIQEIVRIMNEGQKMDWKSVENTHTLASILKIYLRSLPEPIISFDLYNDFLKIGQLRDERTKMERLMNVVAQLSDTRRHTLGVLLEFVHEVEKNSKMNLMDAQNLSTVLGVNLMRPDGIFDSTREYYEVPKINLAFKELLLHYTSMRRIFWSLKK
jgi:hypothetical protein